MLLTQPVSRLGEGEIDLCFSKVPPRDCDDQAELRLIRSVNMCSEFHRKRLEKASDQTPLT